MFIRVKIIPHHHINLRFTSELIFDLNYKLKMPYSRNTILGLCTTILSIFLLMLLGISLDGYFLTQSLKEYECHVIRSRVFNAEQRYVKLMVLADPPFEKVITTECPNCSLGARLPCWYQTKTDDFFLRKPEYCSLKRFMYGPFFLLVFCLWYLYVLE